MQLFREEIQILGNFSWQWSEVSFPTCNQGWLELMWLTWGKILYLHVTILRHTAKPKFQGQEFSVSQNTYYCVYPHDNIWCYRCPSTVCCFAQRLNMALSRCSLIQYCVLTQYIVLTESAIVQENLTSEPSWQCKRGRKNWRFFDDVMMICGRFI